MTTATGGHRYRFGGPERLDWLGFQPWQVLTVGAVALLASTVLQLGLGGTVLLLAATFGAVLLGRPAAEWAGWYLRPATSREWVLDDVPAHPGARPSGRRDAILPPELDRVTSMSVPHPTDATRPVGVMFDHGEPVVVLATRTRGALPLRDSADVDDLFRGFGEVLETAGSSGGVLARLQQYDQTFPVDPEAMERWWLDNRSADADSDASGTASMRALLAAAAPASQEHRGLLALASDRLATRGLVESLREASRGEDGQGQQISAERAAAQLLIEAAENVAAHLRSRCETEAELLTEADLWRVVEEVYEPDVRELDSSRRRLRLPARWGRRPVHYRRQDLRYVETTRALHAVYRVTDYPASAPGDWLAKLVLGVDVARTISVAHNVMDPVEASDSLNRALTDTGFLDRFRTRWEMRKKATESRRDEGLRAQEDELASYVGSTLDRHVAWITLSVPLGDDRSAALAELRAAYKAVSRAALASGITLRNAKGKQAAALAQAAVPLARGVRPRLRLTRKDSL